MICVESEKYIKLMVTDLVTPNNLNCNSGHFNVGLISIFNNFTLEKDIIDPKHKLRFTDIRKLNTNVGEVASPKMQT